MPSAVSSRADTHFLPSSVLSATDPLPADREHTRGSRDEADVDQISKVRNGETVGPSSRKRIASTTNAVRRISGCIASQLFRELRGYHW